MGIRCFVIEPTGESLRFLRRYMDGTCPLHPGEYSYHDAGVYLDRAPRVDTVQYWPADDARWPTACRCGATFSPPSQTDLQLFTFALYRRVDGQPSEYVLHNNPYEPAVKAPVGAMWYADWYTFDLGPDGRHLVVRCPGDHDWSVDSRCSNCTEPCVNCGHSYQEHNYPSGKRPFDCETYVPRDGGAHRCWVRHGTPPDVTVDKNGLTCRAGAGSILIPGWHGFLRNGELVT